MGTHAVISVYESNEHLKPMVSIYKHYDGYPDTEHGVLSWIVPFLKSFNDKRGMNDVSYLSAQLCAKVVRQSSPPGDYTGSGIVYPDEIDKWRVDYTYRIDARNKQLHVYQSGGDQLVWMDTVQIA